MGKCTRRKKKYTAVISDKTRSPNSAPGHSETAVLPPGDARDHVPCRPPSCPPDPGVAGLEGQADWGVVRYLPPQGPLLISHPSPPGLISQHRSFCLWAVSLELLVRNLSFCKDEKIDFLKRPLHTQPSGFRERAPRAATWRAGCTDTRASASAGPWGGSPDPLSSPSLGRPKEGGGEGGNKSREKAFYHLSAVASDSQICPVMKRGRTCVPRVGAEAGVLGLNPLHPSSALPSINCPARSRSRLTAPSQLSLELDVI